MTAAVLVTSLLAQVKLTKLSDENAKLRAELTDLCDENVRLKVEYECSVSLPELEKYAKTVLGMQKPWGVEDKENVSSAKDRAEILLPSDKLVSSIINYS